jgi:hypothetical protein
MFFYLNRNKARTKIKRHLFKFIILIKRDVNLVFKKNVGGEEYFI